MTKSLQLEAFSVACEISSTSDHLNGSEKVLAANSFVQGAIWQDQQSRDIDPVPAWFGLVPVDPTIIPIN